MRRRHFAWGQHFKIDAHAFRHADKMMIAVKMILGVAEANAAVIWDVAHGHVWIVGEFSIELGAVLF